MQENAGITRRQFIVSGAAAAAFVASLGLSACGGSSSSAGGSASYKDGTYTGQSETLDAGVDGDGYVVISITVKDGKIVEAQIEPFQVDGTPKDESYGKDGAYYGVAQRAVATKDDYAAALVEAGTPDGVDAISGATYLYEQVIEATNDALSQAK